jgi:acyl-CoA reductase-like NAD-dependent aldehyde dehydrogenase
MRELAEGRRRWGVWLGAGERLDDGRATEEARTPFDGRHVADVEQATDDDVAAAVAMASAAWLEHRRTPGHVRAGWLCHAADAFDRAAPVLVDTIVDLLGKPRGATTFEVGRGSNLLRLAAEEISRLHGENLNLDGVPGGDGRWGITRREPIGVLAAVTPFNAPVNLFLQKVAPALAVGNAVVVKPAPEAAVVALQLAELLAPSLPDGMLSILPGGPDVARRLVSHPGVGAVSLTGGVAAGESVLAAAGVKPVLLELGSNAANIVCADADLDDAATRIAVAAFGASGQQCISAQRIIVERPVVEAFTDRFAAASRALRVGDPRDPGTDIGPLVHERRRQDVLRFIDDAEARGGKLVLDGRADDLLFGPTIVVEPGADSLICRDEVFGPVAVVLAADSPHHAVEIANDSPFGLQAACFTRDLTTAMRVAEDLRSGSVWINESTRFRLDTYPFGGYGRSGIGREGVRYAMEELTHLKFVGLRPA